MLTGAPPALTSGSAWKDGRGGRAAHTSAAVCVAPGHTQRPGLLCPDAARRVAVVPLCTFHQAVVARQRAAGGNEVSGAGSINFTSGYAHTHTHTHTREIYRKTGQHPQTPPVPPALLAHHLDRLPEGLQRLGSLPSSLLTSQLRPPEAAVSSLSLCRKSG